MRARLHKKNMAEFFTTLQEILGSQSITEKLQRIDQLSADFAANKTFSFEHRAAPAPVGPPGYAGVCTIVHGSQVEKRRNLDSTAGRAVFLHAIAHIEFSAIDLAFDSTYRFRHLPPQYYEDWLSVAFDEARHFSMLRDLLLEIGYDYGSFAVHTGIYDAMARSASSVRQRMAATHRHLEAGGLDAHPELARKIAQFRDPFALKIAAALEVIYHDEIGHVHAGDFWFRYACGHEGKSTAVFAEDVRAAIPGVRLGKKNMNTAARKLAGFTDQELVELSADNTTSHGL